MQRTPEFATLAGNTLIPANRFRPHPAVGETFCPSGHCIATLTEFQITASSSLSWCLHHRCYVRTNKGVQWSPGRVHRGEIQRRLWCLQVFKRNLTKHKPATMTILNWTQICLWLGFIRITYPWIMPLSYNRSFLHWPVIRAFHSRATGLLGNSNTDDDKSNLEFFIAEVGDLLSTKTKTKTKTKVIEWQRPFRRHTHRAIFSSEVGFMSTLCFHHLYLQSLGEHLYWWLLTWWLLLPGKL